MNFLEAFSIGVSLFIICSPFAAIPALLALTKGYSVEEKKRIIWIATFAVGAILLGTSWLGSVIFALLGLNLAALQIGGGFVVFLLGLSTLKSKGFNEGELKGGDSIAVVPLAIPLMAGPGAISEVIITVKSFPGFANHICMSFVVLAVTVLLGCCLRFAAVLEKYLGVTGLNVMSNFGGVFLLVIAVETMMKGVMVYFPGIGS